MFTVCVRDLLPALYPDEGAACAEKEDVAVYLVGTCRVVVVVEALVAISSRRNEDLDCVVACAIVFGPEGARRLREACKSRHDVSVDGGWGRNVCTAILVEVSIDDFCVRFNELFPKLKR